MPLARVDSLGPAASKGDSLSTQQQVARHLDLSARAIADLQERGVLPHAGRGGLDLDVCRVAYVRHLREQAAGRGAGYGELDLAAERARLAKEQADSQAMKNSELRGELIPRGDVEPLMCMLTSGVKLRLGSVPSRAAPEVRLAGSDVEAEELLRHFIDEALNELAEAGERIQREAEQRMDAE